MSDDGRFPVVPPQVPQLRPLPIIARLARWLFVRFGWRVVGELPNVPKLVVIVAPHSSNWDVVCGLFVKVGLRLHIRFMAKREVFFWPLGPLLRNFGAIPIDRTAAKNVVGEMKQQFESHEKFWLALTPEGTRKKVDNWKSGFWRIAREANVPILPAYFHYPEKTVGLGALIVPTDDLDADMARVRKFYEPWIGKNRGTV